MRWIRTAATLTILGAGAIAAGIAVGPAKVGVEGAYFTRATGRPAYAGFVRHRGTGLFSPRDGNLWIGAGLTCCLAALVVLALAVRARRTAATD